MSTMYLLVIVRHFKKHAYESKIKHETLNKTHLHAMISDKRNMVFMEYYYLSLTLVRLVTFIQTCTC